jgi:glycosyltransferase involved in cell wall biosynthesis
MSQTVVHFTDAPVFGGAEQMIVTLLAGLDRARWNPLLIHYGGGGLAELVESVRRLDIPTVEVSRNTGRRAIRQFLREARPAVFHAHLNWPLACSDGLFAAALARVPNVVATQQLFVPLQSRRTAFRHRLLSTVVDRYIAVSHHMAAMLRKVCVFGEKKVRVIHNGVPLAPFGREVNKALREDLTGGRNCRVVLTLARLDRQKGIGYLIEAASRIPETLFVVAGEGPERAALEAKTDACGAKDRVVFLGHRRDVPELLASCDVFVLPSLYEGLPVSVLEAMASGRPVIATKVGGTDEAVKDGVTGLLVPPADPTALAQAIRRILDEPILAQRLAAGGRDWVRCEFRAEIVAARTMEIYQGLVERAERPLDSRRLA